MWFKGPDCLQKQERPAAKEAFPMLDPENDSEIRGDVVVSMNTEVTGFALSARFNRFSSLIRAITLLRLYVFRLRSQTVLDSVQMRRATELFLIRVSQREMYESEISCLEKGKPVPQNSPLRYLDPYLEEGIIHVGRRIRTGDALSGSQGPAILAGKSYLARLLVLHCHEKAKHQGRHLTEGMVRSKGYWVIGGKRLVASVIHSCVTCRKLRRKLECQKTSPPFTYVGVDAFGPWEVTTRKTRGGSANSKRWAILFTCMASRAVHIELVEEMSTAAFVNALRRFVAIRGKVQEFNSDRGTNFVGSTDVLQMRAVNVESQSLQRFLNENGCCWRFNPPHSSHIGGVWERMIGSARRILDAMILTESKRNLTHDVLNTLMSEVCAIINSRPIVPVSTDPSQPSALSPYLLLTQKADLDVGPFESRNVKDMYKSHWKYVQVLAFL